MNDTRQGDFSDQLRAVRERNQRDHKLHVVLKTRLESVQMAGR